MVACFFVFMESLLVCVLSSSSSSSSSSSGDFDGFATRVGLPADDRRGSRDAAAMRRMLREQRGDEEGGRREEEEERRASEAFDILAKNRDAREEDRYERMRRERRERLVQQKGQRRGQRSREEEEEEGVRRERAEFRPRRPRPVTHLMTHRDRLRKIEEQRRLGSSSGRNSSSERSTSSSFPPHLPSLKEKEEIHSFPVLNPDNDLCVHGYPSSGDARECVCNTDWTGAKCKENPVPSCDRFTYGSCGDVLIRQQIIRVDKMPEVKDFPSCKCVDECIDYMLEAFGKEVYEVMNRKGRRFQMNLHTQHFCKKVHGDNSNGDNSSSNSSHQGQPQQQGDEEYMRSYIFEYDKTKRHELRERSGNVNADSHMDKVVFDRTRKRIITVVDGRKEFSKSHVQHEGMCSPLCETYGKCEWFECACNKGRFGYECALSEEDILQAKKNSEKRYAKNELSLATADLPGSIKRFYRGHTYKQGGSYRGVHYFFESLIADTDIVDPNGAESLQSTLVVPFFPGDLVGNVGWFTTLMERVITYVDKKYSLERTVHPTVWINAMDRSLCTMRDDVHSELPPGAIVVSQFGMWRELEGLHYCFYPDRDIVIPSSISSSHGYGGQNDPTHTRYDPSTKDGMLLFFRGRVKNFKQCLGENIFTNVNECMYLYSQGIRTFMTDWYKDEPRFFLNKDEMLPEFEKYGGVGGEGRAENIRLRSHFCLAAGGNGWDQRFFDAIHRGCVPLMTQLNTSHPYDFLLNYDTFTVFIPNGSQDLKRVPEILDQTVLSGKHSNMVKNLRVVHEAMAWHENVRDTSKEKNTFLVLNGAYHHAVWAIAHRLGREIPSSSAVQLCRLYYHNPYHAKAHDILHEEVREILKTRCFSEEILSKSKSV